jgi:hypothetical protein
MAIDGSMLDPPDFVAAVSGDDAVGVVMLGLQG